MNYFKGKILKVRRKEERKERESKGGTREDKQKCSQ